jgi:hypothetical protein
MAEANWTTLTDSISSPTILRAATSGLGVPAGGGDFVYAWNTTSAGFTGAHGVFYNAVNFAPMARGGRISAAICRLPSGGVLDFAPMIYIGLQGNSVNDNGYILGLQDSSPTRLVLRKGAISGGIPDGDDSDPASAPNILRRSIESFDVGEWIHVQLEFVANGGADAILRVRQNDLTVNDVTSPVWDPVDGMDDFVDDAVGINTGSVPFSSGYVGYAFYASNVTRRAAVDHVLITRQL